MSVIRNVRFLVVSIVMLVNSLINICSIIKSPEDQEILQNDLDSLSVWSDKLLLKFHPQKCKVMHLGKTDNTKYFYKLKEGIHTTNWHIQRKKRILV